MKLFGVIYLFQNICNIRSYQNLLLRIVLDGNGHNTQALFVLIPNWSPGNTVRIRKLPRLTVA